MTVWVVVADASKARIFTAENRLSPLQELEDHVHATTRLHGQDLEADAPGRAFDSAGQGRHAMGKEELTKDTEAQRFAHELSEVITKARNEEAFIKLYLVAPPKFLGMLRDALPKNVKERLEGEVPQDLVKHDAEDIRGHLPGFR